MVRRYASAVALAVSLLGTTSNAAASDAPAYSPLPPPPPPPAELAPPTAPPGRAPARAVPSPPPPPTAPTTTTSTTSTTSAPVGAADPPRVDPDAPGSGPAPTSASSLDDNQWSIAPLLGFGTDGLELGLGVRAGRIAFGDHVWIGGSGVYHVGHSTAGSVNNVRYEASSSAFYLGPEIGYDVDLGPVMLRPYAGIGLAAFTASASTGGVGASNTATKLVLWPGATLLHGFTGSRFFVGGDARLVTIPGGPAFAASAVAGLTL